MNRLNPERRRIVVIAAGLASMSGLSVVLREHPYLRLLWLGLVALGLIYVIAEMVRLRRSGRWNA